MSWISRSFPDGVAIACSNAGIYILDNIGQLFLSMDQGNSFQLKHHIPVNTPIGTQMVCSQSGQYIYIACSQLLISSDYGTSWTQTTPVDNSNPLVDCSSDGSIVYYYLTGNKINYSIDYGQTFNYISMFNDDVIVSLGCTSDGLNLIEYVTNTIQGNSFRLYNLNNQITNIQSSYTNRYSKIIVMAKNLDEIYFLRTFGGITQLGKSINLGVSFDFMDVAIANLTNGSINDKNQILFGTDSTGEYIYDSNLQRLDPNLNTGNTLYSALNNNQSIKVVLTPEFVYTYFSGRPPPENNNYYLLFFGLAIALLFLVIVIFLIKYRINLWSLTDRYKYR